MVNYIGQALDVVDNETRDALSAEIRQTVARHPAEATCQCPAVEAIALLLERGYLIVAPVPPVSPKKTTIDRLRLFGNNWTNLQVRPKQTEFGLTVEVYVEGKEEPLVVAGADMRDYGYEAAQDAFFMPTKSGLRQGLEEAGVIEPIGRPITAGPFKNTYIEMRLTDDYKESTDAQH